MLGFIHHPSLTGRFYRRNNIAGADGFRVMILVLFLFSCSAKKVDLSGSLPLPDTIPALFLPGVITSGDYETHPALSAGADTVYFLRAFPDASFYTICVSFRVNQKWSAPEVAPFSGQYVDADPFVSKNGKTLFFVSNRPIEAGSPVKNDWDIWRVERSDRGWMEPIHLDTPVNSDASEYFPTLADNGNLYFGSGRKGGRGGADIYLVSANGGAYKTPVNVGDSINTPANEYEPFIAPDESYMIYMRAASSNLSDADFYVSYNRNGTWSKGTKLDAPINSSSTDWGGKISRDGKYFLFGSNRKQIRGDLPAREGIVEFSNRIHAIGNGLSDIYYVANPVTRKNQFP